MAGRPTKYKREFAEQLPEMFAHGEGVAEVAIKLGISKNTFFQWCKEHSEFSDSYKKGKDMSEAWWEKLGRDAVIGDHKNFNAATWIFCMKNKFGWKDKLETEVNAEIKTITIPPLPDQKTADQYFNENHENTVKKS